MKTFLILLCLFAFSVHAQQVDYNTIILPKTALDVGMDEKLVQLAWQNYPQNEELWQDVHIAEQTIKGAKWDYLDFVQAQFNLNEGNLTANEDLVGNRFWPRYNLRISLHGGMFINKAVDKRIAQHRLQKAQASINQQKLTIRAETLTRYHKYLTAQQILNLQIEELEHAYAEYLSTEQQFKNGEISIKLFNNSLKAYNNEKRRKVTAESTFFITKIEVEELIGMRLEDVP